MTATELRCSIEWRGDESRLTPGRIVGTLMQYETRAGDRPEMFAQWRPGVARRRDRPERTA